MPNVIDSLVLELGIDSSKFNRDQRNAMDQLRKYEDQALKSGKTIENAARRSQNTIAFLKQGMIGVLAGMGGNAVMNWVNNLQRSDAAVGRHSRVLNMAVGELSAWQHAIKQVGGSAEEMTGALSGLGADINDFVTGKGGGQFLTLFNRLGISVFDANRNLKSMGDLLIEINRNPMFQEILARSPGEARSMLMALPGMNEATAQMLMRTPDQLQKLIQAAKDAGVATRESAAAATEYESALGKLETSAINLGRTLTTTATPALVAFMNHVRDFITGKNDPLGLKGRSLLDYFTDPSSYNVKVDADFVSGPRAIYRAIVRSGRKYFGTETAPKLSQGAGSAGVDAGALRIKPGASAGPTHPAVAMLARSLQEDVPGFNRITAMNDTFHRGRPSAHNRGMALDFTVSDPSQAGIIAAQVRQRLREMGIDATVLDEYSRPSPFSTGGHIHVQFNSAAAAAKYAAGRGIPTGGIAASNVGASAGQQTAINSTVTIGTINVQTAATDAQGVAGGIGEALRNWGVITPANMGQR